MIMVLFLDCNKGLWDSLVLFIISDFNFCWVLWKYGGDLNDDGVFVIVIFEKFVFVNY